MICKCGGRPISGTALLCSSKPSPSIAPCSSTPAIFSRGISGPSTFLSPRSRQIHFAAGIPVVDPYTYCGMPIFANIQAALFYPQVLLAAMAGTFLGDGALPRLLAIVLVAQIVFAGICTYFLAKRLGASPAAAWIAGTVYELGCFFAAQAEHMGMMHAATWLPLCWWCVVELRDGLKWRWLAIFALASL